MGTENQDQVMSAIETLRAISNQAEKILFKASRLERAARIAHKTLQSAGIDQGYTFALMRAIDAIDYLAEQVAGEAWLAGRESAEQLQQRGAASFDVSAFFVATAPSYVGYEEDEFDRAYPFTGYHDENDPPSEIVDGSD